MVNPKKAYVIDGAFATANSLSFSKDLGRRLENIVYMHLRRSGNKLYYFQDKKKECDFLVKEKEQITQAIQVCWLVNQDMIEREVNGLKNAMETTGAEQGMIITFDQEDEIGGIPLVPVWKWL